MKIKTSRKHAMLLSCMAVSAIASAPTPPVADETLDEVAIPAEKEREPRRPRTKLATSWSYVWSAWRRNGATVVELHLSDRPPQPEVRFQRLTSAVRLAPEYTPSEIPVSTVQLSGDRLSGFHYSRTNSNTAVWLALDDNINEADGLPASIAFGSHASLVNLDYLRVRDTRGQTVINAMYAIHPQTRRCEQSVSIVSQAGDTRNGFVLLNDSLAECQRTERSRESGDLLFASNLPEKLRQDVMEVYGPISVGLGNRLGNEPGLVFVSWWPASPYEGLRFERSWDSSNLLLFHGSEWQQGLDPQQRQALWAAFAAEQIGRRFRHLDPSGVFTESAARYMLSLFTAEHQHNAKRWLAEALPGWIAGCAKHLDDQVTADSSRNDLSSIECGVLVQFVYDTVARAKSAGSDSLYDTWRRLLDASRRRREEGAKPAEFLASSKEARGIVQGLLDGKVDWGRFAEELDGLGVRLLLSPDAPASIISVVSLMYFQD